MQKINHVERVKGETGDREFYFSLLDNAAGGKEAEEVFKAGVARLVALGIDEQEAGEILLDYAHALRDNGFNAGFDYGFSQAALLSAFGNKAG